jgi:hypothetical protein
MSDPAFRFLARLIMLIATAGLVLVISVGHTKVQRAVMAVSVSPGGASRVLSSGFLGFNGDGPANIWGDPRFVPEAQSMNPENLRVYGGTWSNFINWRTGQYFIDATSISPGIRTGAPKQPFTLNYWATILKETHAAAVFNLNIMTYCPDPRDPTNPNLAAPSCSAEEAHGDARSWGLQYQLDMLQAAQAMGISIRYIELGNELYESNPYYDYFFPTKASYIEKVNLWIQRIKSSYPGVQIAVVGMDPSDSVDARNTNWNETIVSGVRGEDALAFHTYYPSQLGKDGSVMDPVALSTMLAQAAAQRFEETFEGDLLPLPPGLSAWITEWNLKDPTELVHGSWAQGLSEATYEVDLARAPKIKLADAHDLVSSQVWGALFQSTDGYAQSIVGQPVRTPRTIHGTRLYAPTAGGYALSAVLNSAQGALTTWPLRFSAEPDITGTNSAGLIGQAFASNRATNLLFINLGPTRVEIQLGGLSARYHALQYGASPDAFLTGSIAEAKRDVTTSIVLPPFSVTSLRSATATNVFRSDPADGSPTGIRFAPSDASLQFNVDASGSSGTTRAYLNGRLVASGPDGSVSLRPDQLPSGKMSLRLVSADPGSGQSERLESFAILRPRKHEVALVAAFGCGVVMLIAWLSLRRPAKIVQEVDGANGSDLWTA